MTEIKVPSPGESITEVQIARWLKADGDFVNKDEELAEIDSDKATLTIAAETDGVLKILVKEGETIAVGTVVCTIDESVKSEIKTALQKPSVESQSQSAEKNVIEKPIASPAAEKLIRENAIDVSKVKPTGKGGRITKGDVIDIANSKWDTSITVKSTEVKTSASPSHQEEREERREKMSMLRKKLSQRLVAVKNETAMLTTFNEVDMSAVMQIRKQYKDVFKEKHGIGLGFMSFFTKAVCEALKQFPAVNAYIDGEELVYHNYCDVAIAVSAPKGLMVPVIRNAENLALAEIEKQVLILATKARDGKLSIEEMTGGTFTITNGGVFGSMLSTPIINPPQSAILGMHNIIERPVAINGKVEIRPIMYVALSYDHRIIDGRESVGFLVKVKQMLEEPVKMLFEGNDPVKKLLGL